MLILVMDDVNNGDDESGSGLLIMIIIGDSVSERVEEVDNWWYAIV